jgi:hypothetical protein
MPMTSIPARTIARVLVGLVTLPLAAGVLMFATCLLLWRLDVWIFEGSGSFDAAVSLGLGIVIVAAPATGIAIPVVLWLLWRERLSLRNLLLTGVVVGNVPFAVIVAGIVGTQYSRGSLNWDVGRLWFGGYGAARAIVLGTAFGTVLAGFFWIVALRGSDFAGDDPREKRRRLAG